jgi:hypothetical protein
MHAGTDSSAAAKGKVRTFVHISIRLFACSLMEVEKAFRFVNVGIRKSDWVIMKCPPIDHDHRTFRDEIAFIPVVLQVRDVLLE